MIYDIKTNNESFIKVCQQLKENGVKNCYFPLTLYDKDLQGIDPFDEANLSLKMKAKIRREISRNIWYYQREIVRIQEPGGVIRYQAHVGNVAQTYLFERNIDFIEELPRQNGKTIGAASNYSWAYHFATINSDMVFSNKQLADSQKNIERFNSITDTLPSYLKSHLNDKKDTNNLSFIRNDMNNNSIRALSTALDEASADKLGK